MESWFQKIPFIIVALCGVDKCHAVRWKVCRMRAVLEKYCSGRWCGSNVIIPGFLPYFGGKILNMRTHFWKSKNEIYDSDWKKYKLTMYWLESSFNIYSLSDLELLIRIYDGVQGELHVGKERILTVSWCVNPFLELKNQLKGLQYPFVIYSRLCGPQTLAAVSPNLRKKESSNDLVIKKWADLIDEIIQTEMNRKNDIGHSFEFPELLSEEDLLEAAMSSKYLSCKKDTQVFTNAKILFLDLDAHITTNRLFI